MSTTVPQSKISEPVCYFYYMNLGYCQTEICGINKKKTGRKIEGNVA